MRGHRLPRPLVLVPACNRMLGAHPFHVAGQKYVDAVRLAGCTPLVVARAEADEIDTLLDLADGVLLTGSKSNVHPSHFGQAVRNPDLPLDPARDGWTLPLIRRAVAQRVPLLAICRGLQEVNVALGGSLHQAVQEQAGHADHRSDDDDPVEVQYGPAHPVLRADGGLLQAIGLPPRFAVNSLHGQGVQQLAPGLRVEATAPDGLVEAFSVPAAPEDEPGFQLCVQWHPEWQAAHNPVSMQMLTAFGQACARQRQRKAAAAVRETGAFPSEGKT